MVYHLVVDENKPSDKYFDEPQVQVVQTGENPQIVQKKKIKPGFYVLLTLFLLGLIGFGIFAFYQYFNNGNFPGKISQKILPTQDVKVEKFKSIDEFKAYLAEIETASNYYGLGVRELSIPSSDTGVALAPGANFGNAKLDQAASRVSETNVQVEGIDEADIVKTDGKSIYYSPATFYYGRELPLPLMEAKPGSSFLPPDMLKPQTKVIKAFPVNELGLTTNIDKTGNLYVSGNKLVIISANEIWGFDISDSANPKQVWEFKLDENNSILSSRLFRGRIYIVSQRFIDPQKPCPIPLMTGAAKLEIGCAEIYHPIQVVPSDTTYTFLTIDTESGSVEKKVSFIGSTSSTTVYMSPKAIYLAWAYSKSPVGFYYNFFKEEGQDLLAKDILNKLQKLESYDISESSKTMELGVILEKYFSGLSNDERKRIENEMQNRLKGYTKKHFREYEKTQIVKITTDKLEVGANGEIPGSVLNQFSMDEYNGNLRVATTLSGRVDFSSGESANDVYVLDEELKVVGSIMDLGLSERIYSARFIQDKGYVVTFKQIDPFYVLDLSDPKNPRKAGELKIPGYSSYLHPISNNLVLGVGQEGANVKLSLFDVANPANPLELSKYNMDAYWTEVSESYHAFLLDTKHEVFFLPAGQDGYIFSYKENELKLDRVVTGINAQRAIYLEDFMYIIGDAKIVVLNEKDWSEVNNLSF